MQESLRTVKYTMQDDAKFEKIALKLGRSKRQVFSQMIDYFYRSKKDPIDLSDELLKNTILRGQKEYIGFIKTQETELLIPIKRDQTRTIEALKKIVDFFNNHIIKQNGEVLGNQSVQAKRISALTDVVSSVKNKLDTGEKLKNKFIYILENYIRTRESFTMMTSGREKEELIANTMKQINQL